MENDLISRSALLAKRCKLTGLVDEAGIKHGAVAIPLDVVKNAPAIDPESLRPKGRWIKGGGGLDPECSECGWSTEFGIVRNFCPCCGAKNKEE